MVISMVTPRHDGDSTLSTRTVDIIIVLENTPQEVDVTDSRVTTTKVLPITSDSTL
jgi:hypothetical protein